MKVRSSVKPICEKCKIIKRKGKIRVILNTNRDRVNSTLSLYECAAGAYISVTLL